MMAGALLVAATGLCGCKRDSSSTQRNGFRVAVVVPGSTGDQGWNYSAKQAAEHVESALDLASPVSFVEGVGASERKAVLRNYGRDGYDLVICHGYEFNQVVREIAPDFPGTTFVISGYDKQNEHFGGIVYQLGEGAYLCGVIAAHVSETHRAGFIAAQEVPTVVLCYEGFRNGFLSTAERGSIHEPVYIGGQSPWDDSATAKMKTRELLNVTEPARIDVLFQNADAASRGIFQAVQEHDQRVFVFGANRDQNDTTATDRVLASAVIHVDQAFERLARAVRAGTYTPHVQSETLATGGIDCVLSPRLPEMIGAETAETIRSAVEKARESIIAGRIDPYASQN